MSIEIGRASQSDHGKVASLYAEAGYARAGFRAVDSAELPRFLAQRLASYLAKGHAVLAMQRPAP